VCEAEPAGTALTGVEHQVKKYVAGIPLALAAPYKTLPFGRGLKKVAARPGELTTICLLDAASTTACSTRSVSVYSRKLSSRPSFVSACTPDRRVHEIELANPLAGFTILSSIEAIHWHSARVRDLVQSKEVWRPFVV